MKTFWRLYYKDLLNSRLSLVLLPGLIVIWDLFLLSRTGRWQAELVFGLTWIPFSLVPFVAIWNGFQSYRSEWTSNTSYLLLSLPVSGWKIAGSKLLAVATELSLFTLLSLAGTWLVVLKVGLADVMGSDLQAMFTKPMILTFIKGVLGSWAVALIITTYTQFASLVSRLADRFQGLLALVAFLLTFWAGLRFAALVAPALRWLPDLTFNVVNVTNGLAYNMTVRAGSAPWAGLLLFTVLVFAACAWLVEREVEV